LYLTERGEKLTLSIYLFGKFVKLNISFKNMQSKLELLQRVHCDREMN